MSNLNGTNLGAGIVPFTTDDTFPTHYSSYGKGGYREVSTLIERDAISVLRRIEGMLCYVIEDEIIYVLKGGIDNSNWVDFQTILAAKVSKNITCTAGEIIGGDKLVKIINGKIYVASNTDIETSYGPIIGFTSNAVNQDETVVVKNKDIIDYALITSGTTYFLGENGDITNIAPSSGILQVIGFGIDTNKIMIDIGLPIRR